MIARAGFATSAGVSSSADAGDLIHLGLIADDGIVLDEAAHTLALLDHPDSNLDE